MSLDISVEKNGAGHVVKVSGEIDALSVGDFQKALHPLINSVPANVVLDCEGIKYINSRGVGVLMQAHRQAMISRGMLVLIGVGPYLIKVFDMTSISQTFIFSKSLEEALEKFA